MSFICNTFQYTEQVLLDQIHNLLAFTLPDAHEYMVSQRYKPNREFEIWKMVTAFNYWLESKRNNILIEDKDLYQNLVCGNDYNVDIDIVRDFVKNGIEERIKFEYKYRLVTDVFKLLNDVVLRRKLAYWTVIKDEILAAMPQPKKPKQTQFKLETPKPKRWSGTHKIAQVAL